MAYQSYFAPQQKTTKKAGAASYSSYFGNSVQTDGKHPTDAPAAYKPTPAKQPPQSLFNKVKTAAVDIAKAGRDTAQKSYNTVHAAQQGIMGVEKAALQVANRDTGAAKETIKKTNKIVDTTLDHGAGNKGSYLSSKQAATSGGGAKGLKENFVKPVTKATAEVAPWIIPAGRTAKGASLFAKVANGAVQNAVVSGASNAASQAVDTGHVDLKQTGKAARDAAVIGGLFPAAGGAAKAAHGAAAKSEVIQNAKAALGKDKATNDLITRTRINTLPKAVHDEHMATKDALASQAPAPPHEAPVAVEPTGTTGSAAKTDVSSAQDTPFVPHIPGAKTHLDTPEVIAAREAVQAVTPTHLDTSLKRQLLRKQVADTLTNQGGQADPTKAPKVIKQNKRADIVLGAPASGKANIVDPLVAEHSARLLDSDEAKGMLGDVNNANALHEESDQITVAELIKAIKNGDNIVYPLVGKNTEKIRDIARTLKEQGYDVNLHYNHLDPELAGQRAISRFQETGRFVDPHYVMHEVGLKPKATYDIIKGDESFTTHQHYDNNVPRGEKPRLVEAGGPGRLQREPGSNSAETGVSSSEKVAPTRTHDAEQTKLEQVQADPKARAKAEKTLEAIDPALAGKQTVTKSAGQLFMDAQRAGKPITMDEARAQASTPSLVEKVQSKPRTLTPVQTAHMKPIEGYNHSSEFIKDYADMLRDQEKSVKGGQIVKNADGTYKRTSEHSKFYRAFFKENKKAPTKADYMEEATRQLESGNAAFGASGDYKKLLEREGKPIPRMEVAPSTLPDTPQITPKVAKRIAHDLKANYGDLATIDKVNLKEQADKAIALVNDREALDAVISGDKPLPDGLRATSVITALRPLFKDEPGLLLQVANSPLSHEASMAGQELRLARENAAHDPVFAMKKIQDARIKRLERNTNKTAAKAVSSEVKAIRAAKPKVTPETWDSFIDSIRC
jgi:predicted ABC-type ATPase